MHCINPRTCELESRWDYHISLYASFFYCLTTLAIKLQLTHTWAAILIFYRNYVLRHGLSRHARSTLSQFRLCSKSSQKICLERQFVKMRKPVLAVVNSPPNLPSNLQQSKLVVRLTFKQWHHAGSSWSIHMHKFY